MSFSKLGLIAPIAKAVAELGYQTPTDIQNKAIPAILKGQDLLASAQTGTGKTGAFVLPLLQRLGEREKRRAKRIRALVLVPTRELALQVEGKIADYGKYLNIRSLAMYGGVDSTEQKARLIEGVDILVATPGRLIDMLFQRALYFDEVECLVLDEADRMLDMGFIDDINKIVERLPAKCQNLLFSATLSHSIRQLAKSAIDNPLEISVTPEKATTGKIEQWLVTVDKSNKSALLSHLISQGQWQQTLVFIETKAGAAKLVTQLQKRGIEAESIHSGRSQAVREQLLGAFKASQLDVLVATGIAARGLDIEELARVVNYDLPKSADDYIHRIGRTGRAGKIGEAISLVSKDNFRELCGIESRLGHIIQRREIEGFPVKKVVPVSILNYVPKHKRSTN